MPSSKMKILSTKVLNADQLVQLRNDYALNHFDLLATQKTNVEASQISAHIIFTSFKAAQIGLEVLGATAANKFFYCVGLKTNELLTELGLKVVLNTSYSKDLASEIAANYANNTFSYLCNENRLDQLPDLLSQAGVNCNEYITYHSQVIDLTEEDVVGKDIYMWYSPMGVKALASRVTKEDVLHFAIGETTAKALIKENIKSEQIFYPTVPSVDGMIEMIINRNN